jgi:hypothetical protein
LSGNYRYRYDKSLSPIIDFQNRFYGLTIEQGTGDAITKVKIDIYNKYNTLVTTIYSGTFYKDIMIQEP